MLVTVTAVADDSDTRVAVLATFALGVARWSVCWGACLLLGSLFNGFGMDFFVCRLQLLVENVLPFAAVNCYIFPVLCVDVQGFSVSLGEVFVVQFGSTSASLARGEFTIEDVFGDAPILHPMHMAEPPKSALPEQCEHGRKTCTLGYLGVGNLVVPADAKVAAEAAQMEAVQFVLEPPLSSRSSMFYCHRGEC